MKKGTRQARRRARLDSLYAELPTITCQGKCQKACGPIGMSEEEWHRIEERLGSAMPVPVTTTCPLLREGRCRIYPVRPAICRLFGLTRAMPCPFGCQPSRWMDPAETRRFLARVQACSGEAPARYLNPPGAEIMLFQLAEAYAEELMRE